MALEDPILLYLGYLPNGQMPSSATTNTATRPGASKALEVPKGLIRLPKDTLQAAQRLYVVVVRESERQPVKRSRRNGQSKPSK